MSTLIGIIIIVIFLFLGILHFYWALGGEWALKDAIPQKESGETHFKPNPMMSTIVGFGLLLMGFFFLLKGQWINLPIPSFVLNYCQYLIAGIFILRAVGDFNYVGFFKKLRNTNFAQKDTKFYSPLCLFLGILIILFEII